jgi:hypothetical protein
MMNLLLALTIAVTPAEDFERIAKPVFEQHCFKCHSGEKPKAGLNLSTAKLALEGSRSGPVVTAGDVDGSLIVQVLAAGHDTHMPPDVQLEKAEIDKIAEWVKELPKQVVAARKEMQVTEKDRQHWAFRPVKAPATTSPHAIDELISAKLIEKSLALSKPADRRTLARRLWFDLIGLPPTPEEVEAFVTDSSPDAYAKLVDKLLASPHYGERWARHWLDLARFADAEADSVNPREQVPASAHYFRDYVIRSFNADKPYDRFLMEQLAGDLLAPDDRDAVIATAFLRLSPPSGAEGEKARYDELDDMVATTSSVFLGLTVGCARCHDHKTDPIPQRDYYRLTAVFAGTERKSLPVPTAEAKVADEAAEKKRQAELAEIRAKIEDLEKPVRDQIDPDEMPAPDFVGPPPPSAFFKFRERELARLRQKLTEAEGEQPRIATAPAVSEKSDPPKAHLLLRGDPRSVGDEVTPGALVVLSADGGNLSPDQRRLALARWLASPQHPLTARVMVNRLWHYHFGRGFVDTTSNFGPAGGKPTHPVLLDWLAAEFVRSGWSVKHMHRLIVTSATYQQSSLESPEQKTLDPENRLWSRYPRRRLEAEAIRDAILFTSGRLNPVMFGPGARARPGDVALAPEAARSPLAVREGPQQARRSVYLSVSRSAPSVLLESFDQPAPACPCDARRSTTVAPQALLLLNAPFIIEQADYFARRVKSEAGNDPAAQVDRIYRMALGRPPKDSERQKAIQFLSDPVLKQRPGRRPGADDPGALADLAHVIYNLNEFVWVD